MSSKFAVVITGFVVVFAVAIGPAAAAQGASDSLMRIRARLDAPDLITRAASAPVQEVPEPKTRGDAPWNGLLIGAVLGAAIGFSTYTPCEPQPPAKLCEGNLTNSRGMETAAAAALFGAVGLTVDLFLQRSPTAHRPGAPESRGFHVAASPNRVTARVVARF